MKKLIKMKFVGPWIVHGCTLHGRLVKSCGYCSCTASWGKRPEKKKKRKKEKKKKGKRRNLKRSKRRSKLCHSHCWIKVSPRYEDKSWSWQSNPVLHDNQTLYYMTPWKTLYYMTPWKCYWPIYFIDNNRTTPSKDWHVCSNDFSNDLKKKKY